MTAARTLTDADVAALAEALAERLRVRAPAVPAPANDAPLTTEEREEVQRTVRANLRRRGVGSRR